MRKLVLAVLAALTVALPMAATAQASYKVTSVKQIAPNTLKYLLSHYTGAGSLEAKIRNLEVKVSGKTLLLEGPEGKEGPAGAPGARGERGDMGTQGEQGDEGSEGAEGAASTVAGPVGPQGPAGPAGESVEGPEGKEGAASTVAGPQGPQGETGPAGLRGLPCNATEEAACKSTVPGPRGETGARGEIGPQGPEFTVGTWTTTTRHEQTFTATNTSAKPIEVFIVLGFQSAPAEAVIEVEGQKFGTIKPAGNGLTDATSFVVPPGKGWKVELHNVYAETNELAM
jgi:hypothetical protein